MLICCLPGSEDLGLPGYATPGSVGMDLRAAVTETVVLPPGGRTTVPTGIAIALPEGYEGQVRPRSGLAARFGIGLLNAPGTIDPDYRGEIGVILINHGETDFHIQRGDRIAQLVVAPVAHVRWVNSPDLPETARGSGGFGHSGGFGADPTDG